MHRKIVLMLLTLMCTLTSAMAQVTTSGINGKVTAGTEDVIGATVIAIHNPSGTRYGATTNDKGRYTIQGMRVGGPYTITITYLGFKDEVIQNISLALGENSVINADLKEDAKQLGEVVVSGKAGKSGLGAASNFSSTQIANAPTVDRNIYDVAKLSPLVNTNKFGGITIAGTNNRYNSFQIDGMVSNDVFGLASTGTNGGQTGANPISMDAIDQIQVVASPFDVRQSGFTGGAINAITKSGTNQFKGSAYGYYTNQDMYSKWSQRSDSEQALNKQDKYIAGATFGGPIIKDKLFFFASAELQKQSYPQTFYPGVDGYFLTSDVAQQIADRYAQVTGIRDNFARRNVEDKALSLLGRIDWNINANNKFSFRYQMNDSWKDAISTGVNSYTFNNSGYRYNNKTHSFVAELNSHISDALYNEARVGYTRVRDNRDVAYQGPTIYIQNAGPKSNGTINLGTDYSSGVNYLNQDIFTIEDNLTYTFGNHALTFGTHNEFYDMANAFIQYANGQYNYKGIDAFLNDTPDRFQWKYSDANITGTTRWATPFKAGQFGLYAQDKFDVSTRFQMTYGIRFDLPVYFNSPSTNDVYNESTYAADYHSKVGRKPYSNIMVSPRLGFRWYMDEARKSVLRGGVGVFNGRAPFVWVENAWANTGIEMKGTSINKNVPKFSEYGGKTPADAAASASGSASKPAIVTVDPHFAFPQVLRANLAWEQRLPGDINMTLEGLFSKNINNVWFENLVLEDKGNKVYAVEGSEASSTVFYNSPLTSYESIINLTNTNKGYSYSASIKLEKSFKFGLDLMASYTFGHSFSVNDGTSSVAYSNWGYNYSTDSNKPKLSYSLFDMPHRVLITAVYNSPKYARGLMQTHVGLTYNGYSGQRYSLTMSDSKQSFNGDYRTGNSLLYIPTEAELAKMKFVSEEDRANFGQWIANDKYAKDHRGQYAERNGAAAPWENHFDFHLSQDFYYLKERGSKIELSLDILNVANLLNHDWGTYYSSSYNLNILNVASIPNPVNGVVVPTFKYAAQQLSKNDIFSRWHMQVGLRVTF